MHLAKWRLWGDWDILLSPQHGWLAMRHSTSHRWHYVPQAAIVTGVPLITRRARWVSLAKCSKVATLDQVAKIYPCFWEVAQGSGWERRFWNLATYLWILIYSSYINLLCSVSFSAKWRWQQFLISNITNDHKPGLKQDPFVIAWLGKSEVWVQCGSLVHETLT